MSLASKRQEEATSASSSRRRRKNKHASIPLSAGMVLVTLGVVYGDIGTSPMYTLKAIVSGNGGLTTMSTDTVLGALSLIIWTLTLITTVKYVLVAMKADNHNEGGIFALYSLIKRCGKWLILPAMIGGAALLADGILTPAVTVTSAIEGLRTIEPVFRVIGNNQSIVVAITIVILCVLFGMQRAGTSRIGKAFGPIMTIWFLYLGLSGLYSMTNDFTVLRAINPIRGIEFLFNHQLNAAGLMVLGNVFLCTTGAEALYSDMGHVGRSNIYVSWPFVKICLILNYLGQGAWLIVNHTNPTLMAIEDINPFFQMLPEQIRYIAVVLSTFAAIIASQALITGSYSIVSEAVRLDLMPHMKINYPSETKGQLYIPLVNTAMWIGCIGVVLFFQSSEHMEAAYGLAITVTMLMTTLLLFTYLAKFKHQLHAAIPFVLFFGFIEVMFFIASITKFFHGGYVSALLATLLFVIMYVWRRGTAIEKTQTIYLPVKKYLDQLHDLTHDEEYPLLADNLIFLTNDSSFDKLDRDILYSILDKRPKRARAYYFINVQVSDEPFTHEYIVNNFDTDFLFKIQIRLGFKVNQRVNTYLYQIVSELVESKAIAPQNHKYSIYKDRGTVGDFKFCLLRKVMTPETTLTGFDQRVLGLKYVIRRLCGSPARWYGLESSNIIFEYVPLFTTAKQSHRLRRIPMPSQEDLDNSISFQRLSGNTGEITIEDDEDLISEHFKDVKQAVADTAKDLVGGDTASFKPLVLDEDDYEELTEGAHEADEN